MTNNYWLLVHPWRVARRVLAASVAIVYGATNVVFCHATESNFWSERRKALRSDSANTGALYAKAHIPVETIFKVLPLSPLEKGSSIGKLLLPESHWLPRLSPMVGEIRSTHFLPNKQEAPTVFLIQDIHEVFGAQQNISTLIETISSHQNGAGGPLLVGLEGAVGAFHLEPFRRHKDEPFAPIISRILLKSNQISGPEHFALNTKNPPLLWGVEDPTLYGDLSSFANCQI